MTAQLRAAEAAADLTVPAVTPKSIVGSNPGLDRSFEGLDFFDQRFANNGNQFSIEPPDQGLCVGNGFVLETVNDVLQVYSPGGRALSPVTDLNSFYGYPAQIDRTTGLQGPFVTDPSCLYDPAHRRFFHLALTLESSPTPGVHRHQPPRHRRLTDLRARWAGGTSTGCRSRTTAPRARPATPTAPASATTRTWAPTRTAST